MRKTRVGKRRSLFLVLGLIATSLGLSVTQSFVAPTAAEALVQDPAFQSLIGTQAFGDGTIAKGIKAAVKIGDEIYFGGDFQKVNGSGSAYYLAKYDLTTNLVSTVPGWTNKGVVYALSTITDANGTFLIVGGNFVDAATSYGDYLVKYKVAPGSSEWTPFLKNSAQATPTSNATVYSLAWDSNSSTLFVGGKWYSFPGQSGANHMAAITNATSASSSYAAISVSTCNTGVRSLALSGGYLYAAGDCTIIAKLSDAGQTPLAHVARRNLTSGTWDSITTTRLENPTAATTSLGLRDMYGKAGPYPTAIAVDTATNSVYVGGYFAYIGNSTVTGVTPLNGLMWASSDPNAKSEWKQVVTGTSVGIGPLSKAAELVRSLVVHADGIVVSGAFQQLGGSTLGSTNGAASAITVFSRMVKIQGSGSTNRNLVTFGGGSGSTIYLDNAASGILGPMTISLGGVSDSYYVVFGNFTNGGLVGANDGAALWRADGSGWVALGATAPLNNTVYATAVTADNRYIYVGGDFTNLGGTASANYLAVYDRQTQAWSVPAWWFPTSTTSRFRVRALKISGDYIYMAGISEVSGSTPRGSYVYRAKAITPTVNSPVIAAVGGTRIQSLQGATNYINTIEFDQAGRLVVGGKFTKVAEANCTAPVDSMRSLFRVVLAGTEACEKFRSDDAPPVGDGVVHSIVSATVDGLPVLAIGGIFSDLASNPILDNVAIWDDAAGSNGLGDWLDLGSVGGQGPVQGDVFSLVVHGNRLYIGGTFSNAGGDAQADNLAAVDIVAKTWSDLGTTPDASVYALAQVGVTLYVGGVFTGSSAIPDVKALFQIALAPMTASPDTSISSIVGRTGGSISAGAIYTMSKKRVGSGVNADNFIYIGGTFENLGGDPTGDRIGLVQPTFNDLTIDPVSDVGLDVRTVPVTVTATAGAGVVAVNDTSSVCTWASNVFSLHRVGTCQATFNHSGGSGFAAATTKTVSFEVLKVDDIISFPGLSNRPYSALAFDPGVTTVSDRSATLTVDSGSAAVCSITSGAIQMLGAGTCLITASIAGDTDWNAAVDVSRSFTVTTASQSITFVAPGEQENGSQLTLNATASSTLAVSYNSQTNGVCTTNGAVVSFVAGGNCTIVASQSGDSRFNAAESVSRTFYVWPNSRHDLLWNAWEFPSQAVQMGSTATVRALAQKTADASVVTEVEWQVDTPSVCSLSATLGSGRRTLTPLAPGTCTLTLSRAGDASFRSLASRSASLQVEAAPVTTAPPVTTPPATVAPESVAPVTVNNTYILKRTGKTYKTVMVAVRPRSSGETIMLLKSSPRTVCNVGNFGTLKKPIWKAVMIKPGTCSISMTIKKKNGSTYKTTTKVVVKG